MRQITSAEFRKAYPTLTEPVEVTALGRKIGAYYPSGEAPSSATPKGFQEFRPAPKSKK